MDTTFLKWKIIKFKFFVFFNMVLHKIQVFCVFLTWFYLVVNKLLKSAAHFSIFLEVDGSV
jgi:hypothetical protein